MNALLSVRDVHKRFGGIVALEGVGFDVDDGSIVGLIGPNGSGKTTLVNVINGIYRPDRGELRLRDDSLRGIATHEFARRGISRTFQNARVFASLTALDNMVMAALHLDHPARVIEDRALELLSFVGLADKHHLAASELSGGQQKLLEFARALMVDPVLVLMDEPFAGVHPTIKADMLQRIRDRNAEGTAFVVVSHEIPALMDLSSRVICLAQGRVIADGTPDTVRQDAAVVEAYLGHEREVDDG